MNKRLKCAMNAFFCQDVEDDVTDGKQSTDDSASTTSVEGASDAPTSSMNTYADAAADEDDKEADENIDGVQSSSDPTASSTDPGDSSTNKLTSQLQLDDRGGQNFSVNCSSKHMI